MMSDWQEFTPEEQAEVRARIRSMSQRDLGTVLIYISGYSPEATTYGLRALKREMNGETDD